MKPANRSGGSVRSLAVRFAVAGILVPTAAATPVAQKPRCEDLRGMIRSTYDFRPSELSEARKLSKSKDIDRIWDLVKAHPEELLPCLREELGRKDANRWFLHDGSDLLVHADFSRKSKQLQVRLWSQDDLEDIDTKDWADTLVWRGTEGFDVSAAGERWLADLPARRIRREDGLDIEPRDVPVFLFGSMKEAKALPSLVRIVETPDHPGRFVALHILFLLATPESLDRLEAMAKSHPSPDIRVKISSFFQDPPLLEWDETDEGPERMQVRAALASYLSPESKVSKRYWETRKNLEIDWTTACARVLTAEDAWLVRRVRRQVVRGPDQYSLQDYYSYSCLLLTLIWDPKRAK